MYKEIIKKYYVFIAIVLFFMSYMIWWPYNWMITDSMSYSSQAFAFADGKFQFLIQDFITGDSINIIHSPYSLGTASYLSIFVFIFGKHGIFAGSLFSVLGSALLLGNTLKRNRYPTWAVCLLFLAIPILFFSRSLMSCMPSLLIVSIFLYYFFRDKYLSKEVLIIGFIAGVSAWFRETNLLLLVPFCLYLVYEKWNRIFPLIKGGIFGLAIKFISSYIVYGELWFVSASSGFSFNNLGVHFPLYLFITVMLIPIGLLFVFLSKTKANIFMKLATAGFLLTYIFYNYTAVPFSGFAKGSILTSRFMIPMVPIMVIGFGELISRIDWLEKVGMYLGVPVSILLIPISQYTFHNLYANHEIAAQQLSEIVSDHSVMYDQSGYTNIIRYLNPLTSSMEGTSDIRNFTSKNLNKIPVDCRFITSMSSGNQEKIKRTSEIQKLILKQDVYLLKKIEIDSENWLEVYGLRK